MHRKQQGDATLIVLCLLLVAWLAYENVYQPMKFEAIRSSPPKVSLEERQAIAEHKEMSTPNGDLSGLYVYTHGDDGSHRLLFTETTLISEVRYGHYEVIAEADFHIDGATVVVENIEGDLAAMPTTGFAFSTQGDHRLIVHNGGSERVFESPRIALREQLERRANPHYRGTPSANAYSDYDDITLRIGVSIFLLAGFIFIFQMYRRMRDPS